MLTNLPVRGKTVKVPCYRIRGMIQALFRIWGKSWPCLTQLVFQVEESKTAGCDAGHIAHLCAAAYRNQSALTTLVWQAVQLWQMLEF